MRMRILDMELNYSKGMLCKKSHSYIPAFCIIVFFQKRFQRFVFFFFLKEVDVWTIGKFELRFRLRFAQP